MLWDYCCLEEFWTYVDEIHWALKKKHTLTTTVYSYSLHKYRFAIEYNIHEYYQLWFFSSCSLSHADTEPKWSSRGECGAYLWGGGGLASESGLGGSPSSAHSAPSLTTHTFRAGQWDTLACSLQTGCRPVPLHRPQRVWWRQHGHLPNCERWAVGLLSQQR